MCIRDSLKGTPNLCVRYPKDFSLHGYSDASHSDDSNNSRSVSGYLYMFAGGPVTWSSKKQPVVALSSCETEYIARAYAIQEAVYLQVSVCELTFPQFASVQIYEDNMGALQLSGTTAFSSRTKHICTRCHFLRELVTSNKSSYLMSRQQISWRTFSPNSWTTRSLRPSWTR